MRTRSTSHYADKNSQYSGDAGRAGWAQGYLSGGFRKTRSRRSADSWQTVPAEPDPLESIR